MKDLFGKAILDFQTKNSPENLITETSISESDELSVAYLFRSIAEMPEIEQTALERANGKILDAGCGAGSHSLYLQNEKQLDVTALDLSPNAIEACKLRGVKKTIVGDIMAVDEKFDTVLLLMNGAGMCGKLERMPEFLTKLKSLLNDGGQILLDSSDIIYMFDEDDDGGKWIPGDRYYGEVVFNVSYKGEDEVPFNWLYVDFGSLSAAAAQAGLQCEMVCEGAHFDYLARLSV